MVRIVLSSPDRAEIDPTGKKEGRGVYLCCSVECWSKGLKKKERLERALRSKISASSWAALVEAGEALVASNCEEVSPGKDVYGEK